MYDAYNPWKRRGGELNVTYLGSWNIINQFDIVLKESKLKRRTNMRKLPLKALFYWVLDLFTSFLEQNDVIIKNFL